MTLILISVSRFHPKMRLKNALLKAFLVSFEIPFFLTVFWLFVDHCLTTIVNFCSTIVQTQWHFSLFLRQLSFPRKSPILATKMLVLIGISIRSMELWRKCDRELDRWKGLGCRVRSHVTATKVSVSHSIHISHNITIFFINLGILWKMSRAFCQELCAV